MTDTAITHTTEAFTPDLRSWEVTWTAPDGLESSHAPVIGWLTVAGTDHRRHIVPAVLAGGEIIPARLAGPVGWTMRVTGGYLPSINVLGPGS